MSLSARGLTLGYGQRILCSELSFQIEPGQCWAVLGNNGSGKTTLLHTLAGLRRPLTGTVTVDGRALDSIEAGARARAIALLLQEEPLEFWGTVLEYVCLGRYPHRRSWLGQWADDEHIARAQLERLEMTAFAERALSSLSGGERQRARLALALAQQPVYHLLDEPLQHLDLRHQARVLDCYAQLAAGTHAAVVMVLHDPRLAQRCCDHALLLFDTGAALAGERHTVLTEGNLERLYGIPVTL